MMYEYVVRRQLHHNCVALNGGLKTTVYIYWAANIHHNCVLLAVVVLVVVAAVVGLHIKRFPC